MKKKFNPRIKARLRKNRQALSKNIDNFFFHKNFLFNFSFLFILIYFYLDILNLINKL